MKSSSQSHSPRTPSPRARGTAAAPGADHARSSSEPWVLACVDDTCVNDVESFARTVAAVKSKPRPDLLPSVLSHYAAKWLPDVATSASGRFLPPESPTATWLKKRLLLESLVAALPPGTVRLGLRLRLLHLRAVLDPALGAAAVTAASAARGRGRLRLQGA